MLVVILGLLDIIFGATIFFINSISNQIAMIFGILLLIKSSLGFLTDFASWVDFLAGLIFITTFFVDIFHTISFIFGILLVQKGTFSFL